MTDVVPEIGKTSSQECYKRPLESSLKRGMIELAPLNVKPREKEGWLTMLIGGSNSKIVPEFLRPSRRQSLHSYRPQSEVSRSEDMYVPSHHSRAAEKKSSLGKTVLLTALGAAVGTGIAALCAPLIGAVIVGGGVGAIAGAAIGQGALTDSGTGGYDPRKGNPYTDPFHPDSPLNPMNPNNPVFWDRPGR